MISKSLTDKNDFSWSEMEETDAESEVYLFIKV